ncbi:hypothetical protein [Thiosocius teredinicola]|uniref:hypothetical protein n=1 Tax=Thiosocius teredinicola TaxID=1973002 RepID=UPI000990F082
MHNKAVKPFAMLTRTFGTPRALAHGFAIFAQPPLRTKRRLPWRYAKRGFMKQILFLSCLALTLAGCAANAYKEPSKDEPHAIFNTNAKLVPIEIDGGPRPNWKMSNWTYRLRPGKVSMFVGAEATGVLRAYGGIEFVAESGATYEPVLENGLETVTLSIMNSETKEIVASSELRKQVAPYGYAVPIVVPSR